MVSFTSVNRGRKSRGFRYGWGGGVDFTIKRERFNGSIRRLARRTNSSLKAKSIFVGSMGLGELCYNKSQVVDNDCLITCLLWKFY